MDEVYERLYISNDSYCQAGNSDMVVVHACKSPCHQRVLNYRGSLPNTHPNYLVLETDDDLYLNMIDPPVPLFMPQIFTDFLLFADKHWNDNKNILIHCNLGESRAPSLALLFLAKSKQAITNDSYQEAKQEFTKIFPRYNPGLGIQQYLTTNWELLSTY